MAGTATIAAPARRKLTRRRRLSGWFDDERTLGYVLVAPVVLLLGGLVAYPLTVAIGYALSDRTIADTGEFIGLDNVSANVNAPPPPSVPEPASIALLGAGLVGTGVFRRRRSAR